MRTDMSRALYLIDMRRWGDDNKHSYFWGLWENYSEAEKHAKEHMVDRAGKYDGFILRANPNSFEWEVARIIHWGDFDVDTLEDK